MKHRMLVVIAIGLAATGAALVAWQDRAAPPAAVVEANPAPTGERSVTNVDDLMQEVDRYRHGPVRVEGVVSGTFAAERIVALIDRREFAECGVTTCAERVLPVRWPGPMPQLGEKVRVVGEIQETGGKLIFATQSVEKADEEPER